MSRRDGTYLTGKMRHDLKLAPGVEPPDPARPVSRGSKPDIDYHGESVTIKPDDPAYPGKRAKIVKVDAREGSAYLGLDLEGGPDHIVWRYVNQVEFA